MPPVESPSKQTWTAPDLTDSEWATAAEVMSQALIAAGPKMPIYNELDAWLSAGPIRATAEAFVQEFDFGPVSLAPPRKPSLRKPQVRHEGRNQPIMIGPAFWESRQMADTQIAKTYWGEGVFISSIRLPEILTIGPNDKVAHQRIGYRLVAYGVCFLREDVERLLAEIRKQRTSGRKRPSRQRWNFAPILAKLESEIASGDIKRLGECDGYGVQAEIEREIAFATAAADGTEPSESTVRRRAKRILDLWAQKTVTE